jgi:hypothetical protein
LQGLFTIKITTEGLEILLQEFRYCMGRHHKQSRPLDCLSISNIDIKILFAKTSKASS